MIHILRAKELEEQVFRTPVATPIVTQYGTGSSGDTYP